MSRGRLLTASLVLLLAPSSRGAEVDASGVRRLLAVLGGIVQEYGEAFTDDCALSRPIELEEAGLLLADARNQAERLGQKPPDLERQLAALGKAIEVHWVDAGHMGVPVEQAITEMEYMLRFAYRVLRKPD